MQESAAGRQSADGESIPSPVCYLSLSLPDKLYDSLRAEAALHAKLRAEFFQKAAVARSKKQTDVAQYYAQQVTKCRLAHNTSLSHRH